MPKYKYLIVGAGMTSSAAVEGIREIDKDGTIGLIGQEPDPPYTRPLLSKGLWKGEHLDSIWRPIDSVSTHLGRTAMQLDPKAKTVTDDKGTIYEYDKLLLATGASVRTLPFGGDDILYYRTFQDYKRLRHEVETSETFAVIGSGFIGSETAAALAMNGKHVHMIFPDHGIGSRIFDREMSVFLNDYFREKGVEVHDGVNLEGCVRRGSRLVLSTTKGEIEIDHVVAGIGVTPNVELAKSVGLEVENGIRVNDHLQTSDPNIYAAGDVASIHHETLNEWRRVEHEDNANAMGAFAGAAMAGRTGAYDYLPFFYSDLFDIGFEAVGDVDSRLETFADWKEPFKEGVVYYLSEGRVRGVLNWNVWESLPAAREVIETPGPFDSSNLKGRIKWETEDSPFA